MTTAEAGEPIVLDPVVLGEAVTTPAEVTALAPRELATITAGETVSLDPIRAHEPVSTAAVTALEPVPVYLLTDDTGTTWWGGYGPPTSPMAGVEVGDYYLDYTSGEVYRMTADNYGNGG